MLLRAWRFATLTLVALSMGPALGHALELRPKMGYDAALYLRLFKDLYQYYGKIGGIFEIGAVIAVIVLAYLVRDRERARAATFIGAALMVAAHAAFWIWVAPMNDLMASWTVGNPPSNWTAVRDQWEYTHLARFFLQLGALAALLVSVLRETPLVETAAHASGESPSFTGFHRRAAE